ncbi:MAG: type II toxin-antitoxin system VapC family toxin [Thermoplasmata archaeon]
MRCFDVTFLIDYVRGGASAVEKVRELLEASERMTTPAIAAAEVLVGAHYRGGREPSQTLELLERLDVIPFGIGEVTEAGRLGAESIRRGAPLVGNDLLAAATARHHRGILVSRDAVFSGVPGLAVEVY